MFIDKDSILLLELIIGIDGNDNDENLITDDKGLKQFKSNRIIDLHVENKNSKTRSADQITYAAEAFFGHIAAKYGKVVGI